MKKIIVEIEDPNGIITAGLVNSALRHYLHGEYTGFVVRETAQQRVQSDGATADVYLCPKCDINHPWGRACPNSAPRR